jgi:hypothetical protein
VRVFVAVACFLLGAAFLAFAVWVILDPDLVRRNPRYEKQRRLGIMPSFRIVIMGLGVSLMLVVLGISILTRRV